MEHLRANFFSAGFISTLKKPPLLQRTASCSGASTFAACKYTGVHSMVRPFMPRESTSAFSYKEFIQFALEETKKYTDLAPSTLQENFSWLATTDGKAQLQMLAYEAPKIRLLRSLSIECSDGMQVMDFAVFPKPEFDLPIFCANFFTTATMSIVVLDLNPLHDVISQKNYKEKYYRHLIPLGLEYAELLPWGGKITSESLKFFSPIVIWTKFSPCQDKHRALYSAFKDYLTSWLKLMEQASGETEIPQIILNLEWQHRYLTWRAEKVFWKRPILNIFSFTSKFGAWEIFSKDPGHQVLRRLIGETLTKEIIRSFLFNGVDDLGSRSFLDYFPEYKCEDGTINQKRSMIGKSFESRPWDARGEFIGNTL